MGLFDEIACEYPLPDGWVPPEGTVFQTKDTDDQYLVRFTLGSDGVLHHHRGQAHATECGAPPRPRKTEEAQEEGEGSEEMTTVEITLFTVLMACMVATYWCLHELLHVTRLVLELLRYDRRSVDPISPPVENDND